MARFRLRFLLQELDLVGPEVILGRSPECQITIEDPLVSRQHARIRMENEEARISDLGSRNGVRVNGKLIQGEALLRHNDRIRLGTQDLVFLVVDASSERLARSTGYMIHCAGCGRPFPGETAACPHCGREVANDEGEGYETLTAVVPEQASWTFQLLGEVIERALSSGRVPEAERMVQRAANEVDERIRAGTALEQKQLALMSIYAIRLARLQRRPAWAEWALELHLGQSAMPSAEVIDHLELLDPSSLAALKPLLSRFFTWWRANRAKVANDDEQQRSARVAALAS